MLAPAFSRAQGPSNPGSEKGKIMMRLLLLCIGLLLCSSAARAQLDQLEKRIGLGSESVPPRRARNLTSLRSASVSEAKAASVNQR